MKLILETAEVLVTVSKTNLVWDFWQFMCAGVGRSVHGGLGSDFDGDVETDNDE